MNSSINYSKKTRSKKKIKFVIIHYTGMQSEIESLKKLSNPLSEVSCHYFIGRKGRIKNLVPDKNIAWHAGKSRWKSLKNLNKNSIGVELVNKGHKHGYQKFSSSQIKNLIKLCKKLKKKYSIKSENFLGHSDIAPLRKQDPGEKFPWKKLSKFNIGIWYSPLDKKLNFRLNKNLKVLFFQNLYKIGYRYFNIHKRSKTDKKVIISFQQHYLPMQITGKIDQKTFIISHYLANQN